MHRQPDKNFQHIVETMSQVQACPWQPFKLNEIVTLEKCLQELSQQDPCFNLLLRKLSAECSLVEPTRKLQHLNRTRQEEQQDAEFKQNALVALDQISCIDAQISFYKSRLEACSAGENEMRLEIIQVEKSLQAVDKIFKLLLHEFGLSLERTYNSFLDSLNTLELIPEYLKSISESAQVNQQEGATEDHDHGHDNDRNSINYRKRMLRLIIRSGANTSDEEIRYTCLELATRHLTEHIGSTRSLFGTLALIVKLYTTELLVEQDYLKALEGHIEYLRQPIRPSIKTLFRARSRPESASAASTNGTVCTRGSPAANTTQWEVQ